MLLTTWSTAGLEPVSPLRLPTGKRTQTWWRDSLARGEPASLTRMVDPQIRRCIALLMDSFAQHSYRLAVAPVRPGRRSFLHHGPLGFPCGSTGTHDLEAVASG